MKPFRIESVSPPRHRRAEWPGEPARVGREAMSDAQAALARQELKAVGTETCAAAHRILSIAEELSHLLRAGGMANEAEPLMSALFEACEFHDLTAQRVGKVLALLEGRQSDTLAFNPPCPPAETFPAMSLPAMSGPVMSRGVEDDTGRRLVNGPRLADAEGHMDQSQIDALFD